MSLRVISSRRAVRLRVVMSGCDQVWLASRTCPDSTRGRRAGALSVHGRPVMVRQVVVDWTWSDGPCPDEGECAESARVVESGDLGDHPANTDAR